MIFASEERAREITDKPVWIKDFTTVHKEMTTPESRYGIDRQKPTHQVCAERLYKRNGIKDPRKELDLLEIYDPTVWFHLELLRDFLLIPMEEVMDMIERGETARNGNLRYVRPVVYCAPTPSGPLPCFGWRRPRCRSGGIRWISGGKGGQHCHGHILWRKRMGYLSPADQRAGWIR